MSAIIEFGFDAKKVEAGLNALSTRLKGFAFTAQSSLPNLVGMLGFGGGIGGAVAGVTGAAVAVKSLMSSYDDLADTALKLGESTETLQRVQQVAELSGTSIDGVAASMLRLEKSLGDGENLAAAKALENLGLTSEKLIAMSLDEKLAAFSDAFQQARASGTGYNDILELMGKSAGELIPLFSQGGEALREAFGQAPVVLDETVQQMAVLNDAVDQFMMKLKPFAGQVFGQFMVGSAAGWDSEQMAAMNKGVELSSYLKSLVAQTEREKKASAQEDAQRAAAKEEQAKKEEESSQKMRALQSTLLEFEIKRMEPAARLVALMDLQKQRIDELRNSGGLFYEATVEGMKKFAEAQVARGSSNAEKTVEAYRDILRMQEQMIELQAQLRGQGADHAAEISAAEAKARAAENEAWWNQVITEEMERQAQFDATKDLTMQVALLQAKAQGQTSLVAALEREQEIRRRTAEIMSQTGMGEDEAKRVATSMVDAQARIDQRQNAAASAANATPEADREGRIKGYSFKTQGGAYERQDHLYGAGSRFRDNQANLLKDQAARNGQERSTPGQDTSTVQTALQTIQQILTTLRGGA